MSPSTLPREPPQAAETVEVRRPARGRLHVSAVHVLGLLCLAAQ